MYPCSLIIQKQGISYNKQSNPLVPCSIHPTHFIYGSFCFPVGKNVNFRLRIVLNEINNSILHSMPGTSRYVTTKNRKNTPERMELMKYNPILKKMTLHKEIK